MKEIDIEGHRGCRGLLPENTIPAFIKAVQLGVNTLEMDVVITKDKKVVLSHEPWMSSEICLGPNGYNILEAEERSHNIYKMNYKDVFLYDCGSKPDKDYPISTRMKISKPLLSEVIDTVESYCRQNKISPPGYNIEIKSTVDGDEIFHPAPKEFSKYVLEVIDKHKINQRAIIQSFDVRPLKIIQASRHDVKLSLLVDSLSDFYKKMDELGFVPDICSPDKEMVTKEFIKHCHDRKMRIIVWTVNDPAEMRKLVDWSVDGIITDYPDVAIEILKK